MEAFVIIVALLVLGAALLSGPRYREPVRLDLYPPDPAPGAGCGSFIAALGLMLLVLLVLGLVLGA